VTGTRIEESVALGALHVLLVRVDYADGEPERYVMPVAVAADNRPVAAQAMLAVIRSGRAGDAMLVDALADSASTRALIEALAEQRRVAGVEGIVEATPFSPVEPPEGEPTNISAEHTAAAIRYGDRYLLKVFRRLEEGISPELEVNRVLNARAAGLSPQIVGAIEYRRRRAEPSTVAVLEAYVPNEGSAWTHAREELRRYFERIITRQRDAAPPEPTPRAVLEAARGEPPPVVRDVIGGYVESAMLLGRRTADLHLALSSNVDDGAFVPEAYSTLDRRSQYQSMRNLVGKTMRMLRSSLGRLSAAAMPRAQLLVDSQERSLKVFEPLLSRKLTGLRIRTHGDYHLDQVLYTGKDFVIIDFDGPPVLTLAERRRKQSALRDVAGMIRSFHWAALTGLLDGAVVREEDRPALAPWADAWQRWIAGAFLRSYLEATVGAPFMPAPEDLPLVLTTHVLEKAFSELRDELDRGAETLTIPLDAIVEIVGL
jgi:maltose alpha-D-glucosyltransferase/alpha-amylase